MIVYRNQHRPADSTLVLAELRRKVERLGTAPPHDALVEILIELGVLESAVADARHPVRDDEDALSRRFRGASLAAGHLVRLSWEGCPDRLAPVRLALATCLHAIHEGELPRSVEVQLPEGYAQYGVYPETYLAAATRCLEQLRPERVVCIGLRSIGTSLSAVVAAALEARGCTVTSYTLRPRGHPFERQMVMSGRLESALRTAAGSLYVVVDEGPGLSGSSLAGTAGALSRLGVADDRIVLLPSWSTDGSALRSEAARSRWGRHRQFTASFEEVWLDSGRLLPGESGPIRDLSAGAWRQLFLPVGTAVPPVQPQHERRKLLAGSRLLAFGGLGGLAGKRAARALALAEAGFIPAMSGEAHGFVTRDVVRGTPLETGAADPCLLDTMARYLAHLGRHFGREPASESELRQMVEANVSEALGGEGERLLAAHAQRWGRPPDEIPVALDGRMLPHEWLRTESGYLKVDALDHHDDHFFPGRRDLAWDVAGTCIEFELDPPARRHFVERYRRESRDDTIVARLPWYGVAYLAFRTGYARMAAESLGDTPDGRGFAALAGRYSRRLRSELVRV